nr:alpha/beta hydrolase [Maliibacterium massiliense]
MAAYPIDIKQKVPINGLAQRVHIIGSDADNPVVLFVHGGPGVTDRHSVLAHMGHLYERITLATWDQRGTGGSFKGAAPETMNLEQFVQDTRAMVTYLCEKFGKEKLYLVGHSWGSALGTVFVKRYPEHIKAYIGQGQLVDGARNEALSYDFVLEKATAAHDQKALATLQAIGRPEGGLYKGDFFKGLMAQRKLMMRYGGGIAGGSSLWKSTVRPILFSGEYSLGDIAGVLRGYSYSLKTMWPEVVQLDFLEGYLDFAVPMFYFIGRQDYNTPRTLSEAYIARVRAPRKELVWFEHSAHSPIAEEPARFAQELMRRIDALEQPQD